MYSWGELFSSFFAGSILVLACDDFLLASPDIYHLHNCNMEMAVKRSFDPQLHAHYYYGLWYDGIP